MNKLYILLNNFGQTIGRNEVNIPRIGASTVTATQILNVVYGVAGVVAVIVIILAGLRYVVSASDASAITRAKNTIIYAIAGLVVIIMAFTITNFVVGRF